MLAYPDVLKALLTDEKCLNIVSAIQESAERVQEVTAHMAALAGGGMGEASQFDMTSKAQEVIAAIQAQMDPSRNITIETSWTAGISIFAQPEVFVLAVAELMSNAIRAAGLASGNATIRVESKDERLPCSKDPCGRHMPEGRYHTLSIRDTAGGMPSEDLAHIVEPFYRKFTDQSGNGGGLGLSAVYCGLRRNGAYLHIESKQGEGTEATICFPVAVEEPSASGVVEESTANATSSLADVPAVEEEAVSQPDAGRRVLVVDDESSIADLFQMILENFIPNVSVDKAENGEKACEKFKAYPYPVMVMDLHMPVMDGQAAFFEIHDYCEKNDVDMPAIIFCTGYAPQASLRAAIEAQTRHVMLNKPVKTDLLVDLVKERLEAAPGI